MNRATSGATALRAGIDAAMRLPEQARNRPPGRAQRPGDVGRNAGAQARTAKRPWRVLLRVALIGAMFALAQSERPLVQATHGIELQPQKFLHEFTLNGAGLDITLTNGDLFVAGAGPDDFVIVSDVPGFIDVVSANLNAARTVISLKLEWLPTDFDTSRFLEVDVLDTAVESGLSGTSDQADIGYVVEGVENPDGIIAAGGPWDPARPSEEALQPSVQFLVTLHGGTFIGPYLGGLTLIQEGGDQPHGFTITNVTALNTFPTTALVVTVTKDASDYDIDTPGPVGGLLFRVDPSIHNGAAVADAGRFWPDAVIESATLTQVGGGNPIENDLDGAVLVVELENLEFVAGPLMVNGFVIKNWPPGLEIASVVRSNDTKAELTLAFTGADFDTDFDGFVNVVAPNVASGDPTTTTTLRFEAAQEGPPGSGGAFVWIAGTADESTLDGAVFTVGVEGRAFIAPPLAVNFQLLGTINTPTRITVDAVVLLSPTRVELRVSYPGVDFDQDKTLSVLVDSGAMAPVIDDLQTGETTVTGIDETGDDERAFISATNPSPLTEANLNGAAVTVDLVGASYKVGVGIGDFILLAPGSPPGDSIVSLLPISLTRVILVLAYNGTDFDVDKLLNIRVRNSATDGTGTALDVVPVPVTAVIEAVTVALTAAAPLIETTLDGAILFVDITNGESVWVQQAGLDVNLFSLEGEPTGLTIDTVTRTSNARVTVALAFDGTDFDVDAAMSLQAKEDTFEAAPAAATTNTVLITAVIEVTAPTITAPPNQTILEDGTTGPLPYVATDPDPDPLTVTATSNNQALVTNASLAANLTQPGAGSTVEVIGQPDANGLVTITLTVSDGTEMDVDTFTVTFTAVNDEPSSWTARS